MRSLVWEKIQQQTHRKCRMCYEQPPVKSVEIIRAASSRDFMVKAGMGSRSPGHHSTALTSCLPQLSVHLPVPAATEQQSHRQQSLMLTFHVLFKWIWAGVATLSHSSCLFSERKSIFHQTVACCGLLGSKSARQVGLCQLGQARLAWRTWVASEQ